ncbi:MAG TPA: DUF1566 domain-containing protein, partial [Polyangium sp.]|nr:DUF1566 domain-containing protein [Polyangium sp.]
MSISTRHSLGISTTAIVASALVWTHHGYADSPPGRFEVVNGTVLDKKTKLTWQQTSPSMSYTWADAKNYCTTNAASLEGIGWRLPSMKEL